MKHRFLAILSGVCVAVLSLRGFSQSIPSGVSAEDSGTDTVKILAMGDSITDGYINGDNGYRKYFCYDLQQAGFTDFDMVGPKNSWTDTATYTMSDGTTITYDPAHAGYSGYSIRAYSGRSGLYETAFDTTYTNNDVSGNMIEAYDPDIVLLQIGTNDLLDNKSNGTKEDSGVKIKDRLEILVDKILENLDDDDVLFVASVPDVDVSVRYDWLGSYSWGDDEYGNSGCGYSYSDNPEVFTAAVETAFDNYNASVKELVAEKQAEGKNVRFADINSVVDVSTGLEDGVHPNESGYAAMGKYWSEQILTYLNNATPTPVTTTATDAATTTSTATTTATTETTASLTEITSTEITVTENVQTTQTETESASTTAGNFTETESTETATAPIDFTRGDVTLDNAVNIADVVGLSHYLLGRTALTADAFEQADLTEDGKVNGFDLALLRQMLLQTDVTQ